MQCKQVGKKFTNYLASSIASAKSLSSPEMELEIVGKVVVQVHSVLERQEQTQLRRK